MNKLLLYSLEGTTILLGLSTAAAAFLYNRRGFATRKTIVVVSMLFLLSMANLWLTEVVYEPRLQMALGGCVVLGILSAGFSVYWAVIYWSLPWIQRKVDEIRNRSR